LNNLIYFINLQKFINKLIHNSLMNKTNYFIANIENTEVIGDKESYIESLHLQGKKTKIIQYFFSIHLVLNTKLGFAKEKLKEHPWSFFKIIIIRGDKEKTYEIYSKVFKLEENSIEINDCSFSL
jgi:hypothetical protein